jgi:gliding motility-associated-like protein
MTTNGDFVWAKSMGDTGNDEGFSLHTTSTGDSYVTGFFVNTVDFNPDAGVYNLTSAGSNDAFISKFDATGNLIWARSMGGTASDLGYGVAINSTGDVFLTGPFNGTADFDPSPSPCTNNLTSAGGEDIFIVKLNQVATLSITSTSVASGSFGETVIITGTGFSDIPGNNVVEFNNTVATVTASTTTSITTSVPAGATTGPIEVTVACATVASGTNFTVFTATINITLQPSDVTVCPGDITTFTTAATGTTNITYQWQFSTDGTTFNDISNDSNYSGVTTATLSVNTMGNFGEGRYQCRVNGDFAAEVFTADVGLFFDSPANCNNQPPVIATTVTGLFIEGIVNIDLTPLLSDPDDNLDLASLRVINAQTSAGASASINVSGQLILNYGGVLFTGEDRITIEVCDLFGVCTQQQLSIQVEGDIIVRTGFSPNGDTRNDFFQIDYIDLFPDTQQNKVTIYNRWGDVVFEISNYDNESRVFTGVNKNGNELPSGTYFYKLEFVSGRKMKTGYLSLRR